MTDPTAGPAPFRSIECVETRLKALSRTVATLDDAVFVVAPDERTVLSCNQAVERIFGYRPEELVGRTTEILHESEESFRAFAEITEPVLETCGIYQGEYRMRRKDGTVFPSGHTVTAIEESAGFRRGVVSIVRDLSTLHDAVEALREAERRERRARAELERSERYFRALIESSHDIVTVIDPDATIRYESPAVETWLGYRPDELVGTEALEGVHPEDRPRLERMFAVGVEESGQRASAEYRFRSREGEWRTLHSWAVNLIDDPVVHGVIVHSRDVTDQRRTEENLQKSRERLLFAEKMESLGRMAGGVVHDFRNWLFLVTTHSELLGEEVEPRLLDSVRAIQKATAGATALVHQLGNFSRRTPGQPEVLDVGAVLRHLEFSIGRIAGPGIEVVVCAPGEPMPVEMDRGQLHQVVFNLVNNAIDALHGEGRLTLGVEPVEVGAREGTAARIGRCGSFVRLAIEDTGPGIDEATRSRIFEPFFTTKETGTGLGLANVYAVVRNLGGLVEVTSTPGEGTCFELLLPRSNGAAHADGPTVESLAET
jgi:PAS domain S-box-containing protein